MVAATGVDDMTPLSIPSSLSPRQTASPDLSSNSATRLTLRRRPARATGHRAGSPATAPSPSAAGVSTSVLKQQPPLAHGHGHGTVRLRKRRRVGLSDEDEENGRFDTDYGDDDAINGVTEMDGREEEGDEEAEGGSEEEWQGARWRESALYREAQRHAGAPSARKTHRHLGIFGLKGFPAEIEHLHDFIIPQWALPLDDPRLLEEELQQQEVAGHGQGQWQEERQVGTVQVRGSERARRSVSGAAGGAPGGPLRDAAAALAGKADGEESASCSKSDQLTVVETASAVDSQVTEG